MRIKSMYFVNPYLPSLCSLAIVAATITVCYLGITANNGQSRLILLVIYSVCIISVLFVSGNYNMGRIAFLEDQVVLKALLRKPIRLLYKDISYIQIDYSRINASKQFWVVLGCEPMPDKYIHQVHQMPISSKIIRCQYSRQLDDALCHYLSGDQYKAYCRAQTALQAYKQER